ncbi:MAG: FtsQ-type POTRA domain-containing protein [Tindallia sp. MSAO_Bac2]|nr:MAG: FtsQ-type POTRA domain-containing protein [Tindallia sp. MSAO_Bac2]
MTQKKYRKEPGNSCVVRLIMMLILTGFIAGGIYYIVFESPLFIVKNIDIQGLNQIEEHEVMKYSGLKKGENLYKVRTGQAEDMIVKHPYIRESEVQRKGFSSIKIVVREREEYAIIPYMGSYIYLDKDQVVLRVSDGVLDENLSIVTGVEFESFRIGKPVQAKNQQILDSAYEILIAAQEAEMMDHISEIHITGNHEVRLITFNRIEVLMGQIEEPAYSVLALKEALITLHTRNMENVILDMRHKDHITVRPRVRQEEVE